MHRWSLHPDELCLLSLLVWTEPRYIVMMMIIIITITMIIIRCSLSDTPVFLPVKSPTVPFRLVVFELAQDIQVMMIRLTMMMIIKNDDDDDDDYQHYDDCNFDQPRCVCSVVPNRA